MIHDTTQGAGGEAGGEIGFYVRCEVCGIIADVFSARAAGEHADRHVRQGRTLLCRVEVTRYRAGEEGVVVMGKDWWEKGIKPGTQFLRTLIPQQLTREVV
jgi:hypothetical protein